MDNEGGEQRQREAQNGVVISGNVSREMVSLSVFHQRLGAAMIQSGHGDIAPSYKVLTDFTGTGDVAAQLGIRDAGNRKEAPLVMVAAIAQFWPHYKEKKGRLPQAPDMLRNFLRAYGWDVTTLLASAPSKPTGSALTTTGSVSRELVDHPAGKPDPEVLHGFPIKREGIPETNAKQVIAGTTEPVQRVFLNRDRILTASEAAALLHISVRSLRRHVLPYRRIGNTAAGDRWRLSDLFQPDPAPVIPALPQPPQEAQKKAPAIEPTETPEENT